MKKYRITTQVGKYRIEAEKKEYYGWLCSKFRLIWCPVDSDGCFENEDKQYVFHVQIYLTRKSVENVMKRFIEHEAYVENLKRNSFLPDLGWIPVDSKDDPIQDLVDSL